MTKKDEEKIIKIIGTLIGVYIGVFAWNKYIVHRNDAKEIAANKTKNEILTFIKNEIQFNTIKEHGKHLYDAEMQKYTSSYNADYILKFPFSSYAPFFNVNYQNERGNNLLIALAKSRSNNFNDTIYIKKFIASLTQHGFNFDAVDTTGHKAAYYCRPYSFKIKSNTLFIPKQKNPPYWLNKMDSANIVFHQTLYANLLAHVSQ